MTDYEIEDMETEIEDEGGGEEPSEQEGEDI